MNSSKATCSKFVSRTVPTSSFHALIIKTMQNTFPLVLVRLFLISWLATSAAAAASDEASSTSGKAASKPADKPASNPAALVAAPEKPVIKHQITGLFCVERVEDLRAICRDKLTRFALQEIDYENGEATFRYDPQVEFPGANPQQLIERFDQELRNVSRHTFGAKAIRGQAKQDLQRVEFMIAGLDCKACSLAVYEMLYRQPGVEQAQASFRERRAVAWIDAKMTDRAMLLKLLRERGVTVE
ncbi:MAG: hypothetical protein ACKPEY_08105 [Planctomycetota bacterium]